ncbi:hypothetical protein N7535_003683 [Penicillium sp. DV-2018c]|nr:hypothetical protein N7535_003683 [Penicillium sp. DV-2018c]
MASGGGSISNHDSPAPGGPPMVKRPRPPGAGPFLAASRRPAPLKTEGLLWAGRRDALPAPGGHRRSDDPLPRELAHSSLHLGGLPPSKLRVCSGQVAEITASSRGTTDGQTTPSPGSWPIPRGISAACPPQN